MLLQKIGHSCILLQEAGKRLLIDPGSPAFVPSQALAKLGNVDAVLLTHAHPDHYSPDALRAVLKSSALGLRTPVFANAELAVLAAKEGFNAQHVAAGQTTRIAGFTVEAFGAPHGSMPFPVPVNLAFRINKKVLHPGDSYAVQGSVTCDVLCVPIVAPWGRMVDAVEFARQFKAQQLLPIHDAIYKPDLMSYFHQTLTTYFQTSGLQYRALTPNETLEI